MQQIIKCRYQQLSSDGQKKWSKWYVFDSTERPEEDTAAEIARQYSKVATIDKSTKLNHEFIAYDAALHAKEYAEMLAEIEIMKEEHKKLPKKPWLKKH